MPAPWDAEFEQLVRPHLTYLDAGADLDPDCVLAAQGLDSLETVHLLVELEEHYRITFPDERLNPDTFRTMGTLWRVVSDLAAARAGGPHETG
jgi:acyl carrier protein